MSYQPLWLRDLVAYSIQAAALVGVGVIMARLLRLRVPRVRMAYWQGLVALCLFLPLLQPWRPEMLETSGTVLSNVTLADSLPAASPVPSIAQIVLWLICTGIIVRAAWMALGMIRLWLYRREAQRIADVPEAVAEAQRLVPVSARFFISSRLQTPATFGYFRPAVLFPSRFLEMEPSMQKAIALHELLHVERRDWLWNLLEEAVLSLLWFHLPLWWAVRSIRLSREQVVDAEAVRRGNARRPYLKALLEMAGQKRLAESLPAALFLRESQLAERVALMMKEVQMSRKRLTVSILSAAGVLLIAGASVVWAFPLKTHAQPQASEISSAAAATSLPGNPSAAEATAAQKSTKVYKIGGDVSAPKLIVHTEPPYTPEARKAHLSGVVVLQAVIDAKGHVISLKELSKPLGKGLDESAMNTVRNWRFHPAMRNNVPVSVKAMVEVSFRYDPNQKSDPRPQRDPQPNPQPQVKRPAPEALKENGLDIKINQAEIQRQVQQAMKQARIAQQASAKLNSAEMQRKLQEAMKQVEKLNTPEIRQRMQEAMKQAEKLNSAQMQRKLQEAMKQVEKLNTPEMRRQMQEAMKQAEKLNSAEMQQKLQQAMKQAKLAQLAASKIDQAKIQNQVEEAMKQARIAEQETKKIDQAEIQREIEQARKKAEAAQLKAEAEKGRKDARLARAEAEKVQKSQLKAEAEKARKDAEAARAEVEKIRKQAEAARKQAEKAQKQAEKDRLEGKEPQKDLKPLPPQPPPPPANSTLKKVAPPLPPPASPPPPPPQPQN